MPIKTGHREFSITVEGQVVPRSYQLLSVSVVLEANKIAYSRLVYKDGDAATGSFAIIDAATFEHGNKLEIKTNEGRDSALLFGGIVVAQQIKLSESKSSHLIITCKHVSVKMSLVRQGRYFEEVSDKDIFMELFSEHGLEVDVMTTEAIIHKQLVQYDTTDWDFCLARAQAAGLILFTKGDTVQITQANIDSEAAVNLEFGATLLAADIQTDARSQTQEIAAVRWDSVNQDLISRRGQIQVEESPGSTNAKTLSEAMGAKEHLLREFTQSDEELQHFVDATTTLNAINRVSGTLKTIGVSTVFPGDVVNLSGLSNNFNGKALVTGVRHEFDTTSGWRTFYQVGGLTLPKRQSEVQASGLHYAKVVDVVDPENELRVKIKLPMLDDASDGIWARVASIDAGPDRGLFVRPEIEDEVIVGFVQNDMRQATVLGILHSSARAATETPSIANHIKTWVTRSGLSLRFDDELKAVSLSSPSGNVIQVSEDESGILLKDENGNQYTMNDKGITIESAGDLVISATGNIEIKANQNLDLSAGQQLSAEGSAGTTLESSAITTVKGSLVQIN